MPYELRESTRSRISRLLLDVKDVAAWASDAMVSWISDLYKCSRLMRSMVIESICFGEFVKRKLERVTENKNNQFQPGEINQAGIFLNFLAGTVL